jgi:hypothetical protein
LARARSEEEAARMRASVSQDHFIASLEHLQYIRTMKTRDGGAALSKGKGKAKMKKEEIFEAEEDNNNDIFLASS